MWYTNILGLGMNNNIALLYPFRFTVSISVVMRLQQIISLLPGLDLVTIFTITITMEHGVESRRTKNRLYANVSHRHRILNSVDRLF